MRDDVAGPCGSVLSEGLGPDAQVWTCFHCGEVCADADAARLHFGSSEHQQPGCQIDLAEYRRMEEVNRRHCEEDTELHRAMSRMECEHQQALRREEEAGYAKGLHDARREFGCWVPVDERLPPEGVRVLVYVPTCELLPIQADEWNEQREDPTGMGGPTIATGHMWDEHEFEEVTHWMFLPTAPVLPGPDFGA